jgi:glycogen debranching enzyme
VAVFGRDSLIVSLQNLMVYPDFARGALGVLGRFQANEVDDYRDAQPGKILHEIRVGEWLSENSFRTLLITALRMPPPYIS